MTQEEIIHSVFDTLPIEEKCTWPGTKYVGAGKKSRLLPCGEPTVGAGIFCDPTHRFCEYHSLCERHKQPIRSWEGK